MQRIHASHSSCPFVYLAPNPQVHSWSSLHPSLASTIYTVLPRTHVRTAWCLSVVIQWPEQVWWLWANEVRGDQTGSPQDPQESGTDGSGENDYRGPWMAAMRRTGGVEREGAKRVWSQKERRQLLTKSRSEATPKSSESACCWWLDSAGYVDGPGTHGDQELGNQSLAFM